MQLNYFNKAEVLHALDTDGYFIHTHTSEDARQEASTLCDWIAHHLNGINGYEEDEDNIFVSNCEVPPTCNFGVISRSDQIRTCPLTQDLDINLLRKEIENCRI